MTRLFAVTLLLAAALVTLSIAADGDKVDLTGTWNFTVDVMGQGGTPTFEFKQEGDKLTGKYQGMFGESDVTGKVTDNKKIEFSWEVMGFKMTYTGTIEDKDNMKGEADLGQVGKGTWKATRKKSEPPKQ